MKTGKQIFAVAGFTFRDAVRKKSFWVTNAIYFVLILAACIILPKLGGGSEKDIAATTEGVGLSEFSFGDTQCLIINESESLAGAEARLVSAFPFSEIYTPAQRAQALERVKQDGDTCLVEISADEPPAVKITSKDMMNTAPSDAIWQVLNNEYQAYQFGRLGYNQEQAAGVLGSALTLKTEMADPQGISNFAAGMALMLMMFMTIYVYGYGVAMSVATEKSTRVMETLIVSAKPTRILLGKCIGMGFVGLIQLGGVLLLGMAGASIAFKGGSLPGGVGLPDLTPLKAVLLVAYFLMGYALFSMINSMCGAMVSKMEDLQSAMMPAALISMLSFYGGYASAGITPAIGSGGANTLAMLIPFTAPYAAPSALLSGNVSNATIAASVGILLVTIVLVSFISGRVYSASVLHYGSKLSFADLKRMVRGK